MTTDTRMNEPNKYAGFLARQNHQRERGWRGVGALCLCGKMFDLDADHALHQVEAILESAGRLAEPKQTKAKSSQDFVFSEAQVEAAAKAIDPKVFRDGEAERRAWSCGDGDYFKALTDQKSRLRTRRYHARKSAIAALSAAAGVAPQAESVPKSSYISPSLPGMIRNLWKSDPSENSVRTALKLAGDLIQELIDLKASPVQPSSTVDEDALAEVIWQEQSGRVRDGYVIHTRETARSTARAVAEWLKEQGR